MPTITSLLDTDLYKLTQMQAVLHQFPGAEVEYSFKCRNTPEMPLEDVANNIRDDIKALCDLRFTEDELNYLSTIRYFKKDFIEFLRYFQLDYNHIHISTKDGFNVKIVGSWLSTILFEVPILAIINERHFERLKFSEYVAHTYLTHKIRYINENPFKLIEFGTRRRYSKVWQKFIVKELKDKVESECFFGTSNAKLAMEFGLKPIGTMAHEFLQAAQALGPRLVDSQKFALQKWADEYRGDLGIALADVVGVDAFLNDYDMYFSKLFDGVRHDSGDPIEFGEKIIKHYEGMNIDPKTKVIVFSDGLSFGEARKINDIFKNRIKTSFGIGTNLTNDVGMDPLQIVIKMTKCNGQTVAKLSDSPGKTMCEDESYMNYLKSVFQGRKK